MGTAPPFSAATTSALFELSRVRDVINAQLPGDALERLRDKMEALKNQGSLAMDQSTADTWAVLLEQTAIPLHNFSNIMEAVLSDRNDRLNGASSLSGTLYFVLCTLVILVIAVGMTQIKECAAKNKPWPAYVMWAGGTVVLVTLMCMVFHVVLLYIKDSHTSVSESMKDDQPNMRFLLMIQTRLANRVLYKWVYDRMAGVRNNNNNDTTGEDYENDNPSDEPDHSHEVKRSSGCTGNLDTLSSKCTDSPFDACDADSLLRTTQDVLMGRGKNSREGTANKYKPYCAEVLAEICRHLLTVRDELNNWDRVRLWRTVSSGVERLRSLLRPDGARDLVRGGAALTRALDRIMPVLQVDVGEMTGVVVNMKVIKDNLNRNDSPFTRYAWTSSKKLQIGDAWATTLRLMKETAGVGTASKVVVAAVYDAEGDGALYTINDLQAALTWPSKYQNEIQPAITYQPNPQTASARLLVRKPADAASGMMLCGPRVDMSKYNMITDAATSTKVTNKGAYATCVDLDTCDGYTSRSVWALNSRPDPNDPHAKLSSLFSLSSSGSAQNIMCVRTKMGAVFDAASIQAAIESLRGQLVAQLVSVLLDQAVDSTAPEVQRRLHQALEVYYGAARYNGGDGEHVRTAIQGVLEEASRLATLARRRRSKHSERWVDAATLLSRLHHLPAADLAALQVQMTTLQQAAQAHMSNFPPKNASTLVSVIRAVAWYLCGIVIVAFIIFAVTRLDKTNKLTFGDMAQQICIAATAIMLITTLVENIIERRNKSDIHNMDVSRRNGAVLVTASARVKQKLDALVAGGVYAPAAMEDARHLVTQGTSLVQAFDHCNPVTAAQPAPPFPVDDIAIRSAMAAVVVGIVLYVAYKVQPGMVLARLREYFDVTRAIQRGDMVPPMEIQRLLAPVQVGDGSSPWTAVGWAINIAAIFIVIWMIANQKSDISAFTAALAVDPDCV